MASTSLMSPMGRSFTKVLASARVCAPCQSKQSQDRLQQFAARQTTFVARPRSIVPYRASQQQLRYFSSSPAIFAEAANAPSSAPSSPSPSSKPTPNLTSGLSDGPLILDEGADQGHDWTRSFHGLSVEPFSKEAANILLAPLPLGDIEIKPDGIIYLPEIKYRRILNRAFGPGGWGLAPRGETIVTAKAITREYALVAHGRLVSISRGEQDYFSPDSIPTATEGCKSNALMRCCKDLGVASELWDPRFIRKFKTEHTRQVFVDHAVSKKRSAIWIRKGDPVPYPWKETGGK